MQTRLRLRRHRHRHPDCPFAWPRPRPRVSDKGRERDGFPAGWSSMVSHVFKIWHKRFLYTKWSPVQISSQPMSRTRCSFRDAQALNLESPQHRGTSGASSVEAMHPSPCPTLPAPACLPCHCRGPGNMPHYLTSLPLSNSGCPLPEAVNIRPGGLVGYVRVALFCLLCTTNCQVAIDTVRHIAARI